MMRAAGQRRESVVRISRKRRRARRRDDADRARIGRERALALGSEPAGGLELRLQPRELLVERADAGEPDVVDVELEFAARLVDRGRRANFDAQPVVEGEPDVLRPLPEHDAAHLRLRILEIEIAVAGCGAGEIGNLAADPHEPEVPFDEQPHRRNEQGNREDGFARPALRRWRQRNHGGLRPRPAVTVAVSQSRLRQRRRSMAFVQDIC